MNITADDILLARNGQKILRKNKKAKLVLNNEDVELSPGVVEILIQTLSYIAQGKSVVVTAQPTEFTTQQAADFLLVSRPFLIKLLETGEIPFRKVGSHRRVLFQDLMAYKQDIDSKRLKVLDELAALDQELGLGY